ncbi:hypothetical protein CYLTODRAFT_50495 [Cylindrobasidium torrendii FP15055 ss-10]|uniref:Uncharacterized protein n=1 Tax=Cylindrobasidium torrendii FP15055 ss-10 TaxID=1314674 RepID=A0A0D7B6Q4_9AGAR|nr:hypothetical protein CYLTODRAFT_50495 [Cylindrobasidium torrendii FP15055 ss-10]
MAEESCWSSRGSQLGACLLGRGSWTTIDGGGDALLNLSIITVYSRILRACRWVRAAASDEYRIHIRFAPPLCAAVPTVILSWLCRSCNSSVFLVQNNWTGMEANSVKVLSDFKTIVAQIRTPRSSRAACDCSFCVSHLLFIFFDNSRLRLARVPR